MIEIENLSKEFSGFKAVDGISFSVSPGQVLGFLGPNGAGKSTTMKMIAGFVRPTAGRVSVMGNNVVRRPLSAKRQVGYLPEGAPLYADMTPPDFLAFIARMRGIKAGQRSSAIKSVMQKLELEEVAHKRIEELSKGFKRRVGIAQAILHDPAVLILDEPTDGLDPNQKHQVRALISNMAADKIVILSTHILEEVTAVCNRAVVIAKGKLLADETPGALQARSRYHQAVTLQFSDSTGLSEKSDALAGLATVSAVIPAADSARRITLLPSESLSDRSRLHTDINALIKQQNWHIDSQFIETGRLEDVFREITGGAHV